MMPSRHVVLAAGGTGGHLFPAAAVARELVRRDYPVSLATDRRGESFETGVDGVRTHRISSAGSAGGPLARIGAALAIGAGVIQAWRLLGRLRPAGVIGFGGYPSVPTMLAAVARGLPSLIHEQNAVLGRANRLVLRRVSAVATSFEATAGLGDAGRAKAVTTGNPVRGAFSQARALAYPESATGDGEIRVLVLGGSQGARVFSDVVPAALSRLPDAMRSRFRVVQQCRPEDIEEVRRTYRRNGIDAELARFFTDVAARMAAAHLVVARSGASTVAELAEVGRPAILVPYPHATDDHQTANARAMEEAGGAWLIPGGAFTAEALAGRFEEFVLRRELLTTAAAAMRRAGGRNAAAALVNRFEQLMDAAPGLRETAA